MLHSFLNILLPSKNGSNPFSLCHPMQIPGSLSFCPGIGLDTLGHLAGIMEVFFCPGPEQECQGRICLAHILLQSSMGDGLDRRKQQRWFCSATLDTEASVGLLLLLFIIIIIYTMYYTTHLNLQCSAQFNQKTIHFGNHPGLL